MLKHSSPLIIALAVAAKNLLAAADTPSFLRGRLKHFMSELRDGLAPDDARRLDGLEAEAVINSFAAPAVPSLSLSSDGENHQEPHQTRLSQPAISADING